LTQPLTYKINLIYYRAMLIPKTVWNYSLGTEVNRIIFTLVQSVNRFYPKSGFLVLPYTVPNEEKTVYLPDLGFNKQIFKRVKSLKGLPVPVDKKFSKEVEIKLINYGWKPEPKKVEEFKKAWQKKEKIFWRYFEEIFPEVLPKIKQVEIRPTSFGTNGSFSVFSSNNGLVHLSVRFDRDISSIAETIVSSITLKKLRDKGYNWRESEAVSDFIMNTSKMKKIFPGYKGTLYSVDKKENAKYTKDAQKYLNKLGITNKKIFSLKNKQVFIDGKPINGEFTLPEKEALILLVKNKNKLCNMDQIAEAIWKQESFDRYSPWAIAKLMQRIRVKIEEAGVFPWVIQTKRREGYLLAD